MNSNNQKTAFVDLDGTLLKGQSQGFLIKYLYQKKYLSLYRYLIISVWFIAYKLGVARSTTNITIFALRSIAGESEDDFAKIFNDFFVSKCIPRFRKHAFDFIKLLKEYDYHIILMSAAIDPIVSRAQRYFSIDEYISTVLESKNGLYTGNIIGKGLHGSEKVRVLRDYSLLKSINIDSVLCAADHMTDIEVLESVGFPVAVDPSHHLFNYAQEKKWPVVYLESDESFQYFKSHIKF